MSSRRMWTKADIVSQEQYEELVKVVPTEVSIIEDEGKIELQLKHDNEVLAVNDTPNQFLQRRLDKPSTEWNSATSSEDFGTWLNEQLPNIYNNQFCYFSDSLGDYNMLGYANVDAGGFDMRPIGVNYGDSGFVLTLRFNKTTNEITIFEREATGESTIELSFNDVSYFALY